jgi:hypothetical protein
VKVCFKCRQAKPLDEFYKHPQMGDGLLGKCKECTKRDSTANRQAKLDQCREYDRMRASMPHRRALAQRIQKRWREQHPYRRLAQNKLRAALKAGKVQRLPCLVCGAKAEAHHPDYAMPIDVVWLCPAHHKQAHAMARAA